MEQMSMNEDNPYDRTRPSLLLLATEGGRAITELGLSLPFRNLYNPRLYESDGHPVMVIPGFMASKSSTTILRKFVDKLGFSAYDWGIGRNLAKVEYLDKLAETLDHLYLKYNKKVSLVGWSLGGVFARQLAKKRPHLVRQVITLGSPFRGLTKPNNALWLYNIVSGGKSVKQVNPDFLMSLEHPADVPTTAIYTKEDGVVSWKLCIEEVETPIHQNVRVRGSHFGLGHNPSVLHVIADRLQYNHDNWERFKPKNEVRKRLFYPSG
jgi:pimeloyl-ACP methyl ester carboxylesterase